MAGVLGSTHARPAVLIWITAVAFHVAIVAALPHPKTRPTAHAPRALEVEDAPATPPQQAPQVQPPQQVRTLAPTTAGIAAAAAHLRAPSAAKAAPEPAPTAGDFDLPASSPRGADDGAPSSGSSGSGPIAGPPELVSFEAPLSPPAAATVDRSRPAALARGAAWSCPWPAEADPIDDATVVIAVVVDERGHASKVDVLTDPGYGFGREARRCALREVYTPGLDRDGRAVASTLKSVKVRFAR